MRMPRRAHDGHNAHQGPATGQAILNVEMSAFSAGCEVAVDEVGVHAVVRASGPQLPPGPSAAAARGLDAIRALAGRHAQVKLPTRPIRERFEDLIHGRALDTAEDNDQPQHLHADRLPYRVSSWRYLPSVLKASDVSPDDVFLDLGAGKGRVVYQAARYPFRRVIGVEISPLFTVVARQNLARKRRKLRCREIELITMDAAEYDIPDDVTVVYLYHPFGGETFAKVVERLAASLDRRPRQVRVIYAWPKHEETLLGTGLFRTLSERRDRGTGQIVRTYVCDAEELTADQGSAHES